MSLSIKYRLQHRLLAAVALSCAASLAWAQAESETAASNLQAATPHLELSSITRQEPPATMEEPHAVRVLLSSELETTLAAQMAGRIDSLQAHLGGHVQKGSVLISFDCREAQARLGIAQAEYASARETLVTKQRLRKLNAAGDMEVTLARADASRATAAIHLAKAQITQCTVEAPFTGYVVKLHVKPHQGVTASAPLLDMISDGPLKLRLNIPSHWLSQVRVGTPFEVQINETGLSYPAEITRINARVDAVAQTVELEAHILKSEPGLLAGMSGIARFQIGH